MGLGSEIRKKPIPDHGIKQARIPDPQHRIFVFLPGTSRRESIPWSSQAEKSCVPIRWRVCRTRNLGKEKYMRQGKMKHQEPLSQNGYRYHKVLLERWKI
jgi:hypothetical protein